MGFFSGLANTVVKQVNSTLGTNFSIGSSSGGTSSGTGVSSLNLMSWEGKFLANKNFQTAKNYLIYKKAMDLATKQRQIDGVTVLGSRSAGGVYWDTAIAYYETSQGISEINALLSQTTNVNTTSGLQQALQNILSSATNSALQAAQNAVVSAIDRNLGTNTPTGNSITNTLGNLGASILDKSTKEWFKKNWYYIILPPVLVIAYFVYRNSNNAKGKKSYKKK